MFRLTAPRTAFVVALACAGATPGPAEAGGPAYPDLVLEWLSPTGEESEVSDVASCGVSNFVSGRILEAGRFRAAVWTLDALPFPGARRVPDVAKLPYSDDDDEKESDQTATVLYCSSGVPEGNFPCVGGTIEEDAVVWDYDAENDSWDVTDIGTLGGPSATPNALIKSGGATYLVGTAIDPAGDSRPVIWEKETGVPWSIDVIDTPGSVQGGATDIVETAGGQFAISGWIQLVSGRRAFVWTGVPGDWDFEPLPERVGNDDGSVATSLLLIGADLRVGGYEDTPPPYPPDDPVFGYTWKFNGPGDWTLVILDPTVVGNVLRVRDLITYESDCQRGVIGTAFPGLATLVNRVPVLWPRDCTGGPLDPADINDLIVSGPGELTMRTGLVGDADDYLFIAGNATRSGAPTVPLAVVARSSTPLAVDPTPGAPTSVALLVPASNPFRTGDGIAFQVPADGRVTLDVHDATGRRLRRLVDATVAAGAHGTTWDGRDARGRMVGAGVVFLRLAFDGGHHTARMVLTR